MKQMFSVLFILVSLSQSAHAAAFRLDPGVHNSGAEEFLRFSGPGEFDNYITQNLPFPPVADLFRQLLIAERRPLTNRGEAHITALTPVEYWQLFRPLGIEIREIQELAEARGIQSARFQVLCLGKGSAVLEGKREDAFFIVVSSPELLEIRRAIRDLLVRRGGAPNAFDPEHFFPHITLGFTKRDLHEGDGVIKNSESCVSPIADRP